jgi:hypothetical protein
MDGHRSVCKVHHELAAAIPPDTVVEPEPLLLPLPFPGAIAMMETGKYHRHSKMKNENTIDTKQTSPGNKKKNKEKTSNTKDLQSERKIHRKMAQVKLSQEDIEQPSVAEPPALQEDNVVDAKPLSLRKEVRKSKKKKKKDNDHHDGNIDDIQDTETLADASMPALVAHLVDEDEIDAEIERRIEQERECAREEERERIRQEGILNEEEERIRRNQKEQEERIRRLEEDIRNNYGRSPVIVDAVPVNNKPWWQELYERNNVNSNSNIWSWDGKKAKIATIVIVVLALAAIVCFILFGIIMTMG